MNTNKLLLFFLSIYYFFRNIPENTRNNTMNNENNRIYDRNRQDRPPVPENPEDLFQMLIEATIRLGHQLSFFKQHIMLNLGGNQMIETMVQWCARNPHAAIIAIAIGLAMMLPLLIIIGFGLITVLMTFVGFLILEGTLLTVLSMLLIGCLGALALVVLFFGAISSAAYFGFAQVYDFVGIEQHQRNALFNYIRNELASREMRMRNNAANGNTIRAN